MNSPVITTIGSAIKVGVDMLDGLSDSAKLDSQLLVAQVLNKPTTYLYTWPEKPLTTEQINNLLALFNRRQQGEPVAYILGYKEFWSLNFKVSPATLIPRPDTEVLVELVLNNHQEDFLSCLDLGTGTGAIALALASENKQWQIDAIDFSDAAVSLAQLNAQQLDLAHVDIFQSDWFDNIQPLKKYDVIVSNPPYIDCSDVHLAQGDVRFEPKSALVAKEHGLADIALIIEQAQIYLSVKGYLYFEHGFTQAEDVQAIFHKHGYFEVTTIKDYNGNDRVTYACYNGKQ